MNGTRTGLGRDVVSEDDGHGPVVQRMPQHQMFELVALAASDYTAVIDTVSLQAVLL